MLIVYAIYALVSLVLTVGLARVLFRHGAVLLEDVFEGRPKFAQAVNQLLVVGFYLVNFGYALLMMTGGYARDVDIVRAVEILSGKLGWLLMSLAAMHFANLFLFHRIRRRMQLPSVPAPVMHHGHVPGHSAVDLAKASRAYA